MAGAQSYTLYYKKLGASNWEQAASKISGTSYTHKGLTTGTTYVYTVRAVNKNQKSSYNKTGISGKPVPATVKLGKVMSKGYNKLKITWSKAAGASGYYIYEKINGKWKKIGTAKSSAAYYIHTSSKSYPIVTGANTTYTVKAYRNVNGKKVFGSYDKKGITGKAIPTKPVWSRISKVSNGLKLQWKKTPGATGYVVYRYENGKWVKKKTLKTLSYTDKTAKKGKTYSYKIRAYKRVNGKTVYSGYSAAKKGKR